MNEENKFTENGIEPISEPPVEVNADVTLPSDENVQETTSSVTEQSAPIANDESVSTAAIQENTPVAPVQEDLTATMTTINTIKEFQDIKPKKNIGLIIGLLVLLGVIIAGGVFAFLQMNNKPKNLMLNALNNSYKEFVKTTAIFNNKFLNLLEKNTMIASGNASINIKANSNFDSSTSAIIKQINDMTFNYAFGMDTINKKGEVSLAVKYKNNPLIGLSGVLKDQKAYILLNDLYEKYIVSKVDNSDALFDISGVNVEDLNYLLGIVKDNFINNLEEKNFSKNDEETDVNGEKLKTTKVSYTFTPEHLKDIISKIVNKIKSDDRAMNFLTKQTKQTKDEVNTSLNEIINDLSAQENVVLSTYLYNNNAVKISLIEGTSNFTMINYKDYVICNFIENNETDFTIIYHKENETTSTIGFTSKDGKVSIDILNNNGSQTLTIIFEDYKTATKVTSSITSKSNEINKDKEFDETYKISLDITTNNINLITLDLNLDAKIKFGESIANQDTSNSIDSSLLTEEDTNQIMQKLTENKVLLELFQSIMQAGSGGILNQI